MSLLAPQDSKANSKEDLGVDELTAGMRKLPVELSDLIYDFTFRIESGVRRIDAKYRPPAVLQVGVVQKDLDVAVS